MAKAKAKPPKTGAGVSGATEAPAADIHLEVSADADESQTYVEKLLKIQKDAYQACLQSAVAEINRRVDSFMRETTTALTELRVSLQYTQTQVEEIKEKQSKENIDDLSKKMIEFEEMIKKVEHAIDYQENQSRRCNLRFDGVAEVDGETWEQTEKSVRRAMTTALELPEAQVRAINIGRAHRTGGTGTRARTIVVKFESFKDRELVLQAAKKKRPRGIYVNEDYSQRVMARRKELLPKMMKAREEGKVAYLSFDKLVVRERHDVANRG